MAPPVTIEGAGEVIAVAQGVTGVEPAAHVVGVGIAGGAFAEYMVLPAAGAVPVPAGWADEQALGMVDRIGGRGARPRATGHL